MRKLALLSLLASAAMSQATLVFDNRTGAPSLTFTGSTPRTIIGGSFHIDASALGAGTKRITGYQAYMVSATVATYSNIRMDLSLWEYNKTATGTTPAFFNKLQTASWNVGSITTAANTFYTLDVSYAGPGVVIDPTKDYGVQIAYFGDTGSGEQLTTNLTSLLRGQSTGASAPPAVGTQPIAGTSSVFYRNASGITSVDSALIGSDARNFAGWSDTNLALQVQAVPEPASMLALGLGLAAVARRRKQA
jgi:hypothetical protein